MINAYLDHQRVRNFSPRTVARRAWSLGLWAAHLAARGVTVATATPVLVEGFLAHWPSPQSRYSIRADLAMFYRFAIRRGLLDNDPTAVVEPPKLIKREPTPIPPAAVRHLLDHVESTDRLVILLAAYLGLRISEIAAIRGEHYDRERRVLRVVGKGSKPAKIPVAQIVADELERYPHFGRLLPQASGPSVGHRIRTLLRRHGIEGRPHDLRASFATEAHDVCHDIVAVQRLMRHSEVATTMAYIGDEELRHDIVDRLFGDGPAAA